MGAEISKEKKEKEEKEIEDDKTRQAELVKKINKITAELVLETSTKDILLFLEPEYCDKIMYILTNIFENSYAKTKIELIHGYIQNIENIKKDFIDLSDKSISLTLDKDKYKTKKNLCIEIALFYIKFCHLYAAIVKVLNPVKTQKGKIIPMGFCQRRAGLHKITEKTEERLAVASDFCTANKRYKKYSRNKPQSYYIKTLKEVGGIAALDVLYKDDFQIETKKFVVNKSFSNDYKNAIATVYKIFNPLAESVPKNITSFSEIPLKDYRKMDICRASDDYDPNSEHFGTLESGKKNENLIKYANHVLTILKTSRRHNKYFLDILDSLFLLENDTYIIHPNLDSKQLDLKIKETRKKFVEMYVECEKQFIEGIDLFRNVMFDKEINKAKRKLQMADIIIEDNTESTLFSRTKTKDNTKKSKKAIIESNKDVKKDANNYDESKKENKQYSTKRNNIAIKEQEKEEEKKRYEKEMENKRKEEKEDGKWKEGKQYYDIGNIQADIGGNIVNTKSSKSISKSKSKSNIETLFNVLGNMVKGDKNIDGEKQYIDPMKQEIEKKLIMAQENVNEKIRAIAKKEGWGEESLTEALDAAKEAMEAQKKAFT
jgi:hypothetical protein